LAEFVVVVVVVVVAVAASFLQPVAKATIVNASMVTIFFITKVLLLGF
jgi:hypothetical protein